MPTRLSEDLVAAGAGHPRDAFADTAAPQGGRLAARPSAHRWVFSLTVAFLGAGALLRSVLAFEGERLLTVVVLLAVWSLLVLAVPFVERLWAPSVAVFLAAQVGVVVPLLLQSDSSDYFAILLVVPIMQCMARWGPRRTAVLIALVAIVCGVALLETHDLVVTLSLVAFYAVAHVFFAAYALAVRRAVEERARNEALAADLTEANRRLAESVEQARRLGAARERQRLALDLHDSVTQTLFSMTLTARAAGLLLRRERAEAGEQLGQLEALARGALDEMSALGGLPPTSLSTEGGFLADLEHHCAERKLRDGLVVRLEVDDDGSLPAEYGLALLRIVQEGLNNVAKHAQAGEAVVRLRTRPPFRLEVADRGRGFDPTRRGGAGLGLTSMAERAAEIGWNLKVTSRPGDGTRVVAEEAAGEGRG